MQRMYQFFTHTHATPPLDEETSCLIAPQILSHYFFCGPAYKGRMIETVTFSSQAIKGFPMGDPFERSFPLYLPPGYSKTAGPYPVVFFLAGFGGKGSGYLSDDSAFGISLQARFDAAISQKRLAPFIGVFPDCTSKLGHSQYMNSPAIGNYMDYVCDELTAFIDDTFPTFASPDKRVVVGHSSGGFGALIIGMLRPDAFRWISSSAGDGLYEFSVMHLLNNTLIELNAAGSISKFVSDMLAKPSSRQIGGRQFDAIMALALSACYAPNTGNPPHYGDLFFDLETGAIRPEIWEKYLAWDPVRMVDRHIDNLKRLRFIQLEAGLQDEHGLQWAHRQVALKLKAHGIAHEVVEYPGAHGGHHWRFEGRLQRLLERVSSF